MIPPTRAGLSRRPACADALILPVLAIFLIPGPASAEIKGYRTDLDASRVASLLNESVMTVTPQSYVSVHRATNALHVQVFSGTARFNRQPPRARPFPITTVVTTEQVMLVHHDAAVCIRVQDDRTSITVVEGVVQLSTLSLDEESGTNGKGGAKTSGVNRINLRSGDRAEVIKVGTDLVLRLENKSPFPFECSSFGDWGPAVLNHGKALS